MQDIQIIFGIFKGLLGFLYDFTLEWWQLTIDSGLSPSIGQILLIIVGISIWMASAFLAATISELKGKMRSTHFIGGLIIPFLYPLVIFFILKSDREKRVTAEEEIVEEFPDQKQGGLKLAGTPGVPQQEIPETKAEATDPSALETMGAPQEINQYYLSSISVDANGNHRGPFMVELTDGQLLTVEKIVSPLPDTAVLEIPGQGGKPRTIRIPYNRIKNITCQARDAGETINSSENICKEGMNVGGFVLTRLLGKGGMGEVWLAHQIVMGREVALKILSPMFTTDPDSLSRFMKEVRNSAKLEHPNIVTAHYAGVDKGIYYMAMSHIDGIVLEDKLKVEKIIPEKEGLQIAKAIATALNYAWNKYKMLHRDIKPANIMLDREGQVKLMDMGIAKSLIEKDVALTSMDTLLGTPHYMSPEQILGKLDIDFRTDIYSLGTTIYHLVTGAKPYGGKSIINIVTRHFNEDLPNARATNPDLSEQCSMLIEVMIAKDRDDRQKSWNDVIRDIDMVLNGEYPATRPPLKELQQSDTIIDKKIPTANANEG